MPPIKDKKAPDTTGLGKGTSASGLEQLRSPCWGAWEGSCANLLPVCFTLGGPGGMLVDLQLPS